MNDKYQNLGPKPIHLSCMLDTGHSMYRCETRSLGEQEANVQIPMLVFPGMKLPHHGQSAVLTLELPGAHANNGLPHACLKIHCFVNFIANIVVGLQLNTEALDERQHQLFDSILALEQ